MIGIDMSKINIPDPQVLEMEALDNAFNNWVWKENERASDDTDYWIERWDSIDANALVFTSSDLDEYDPYDEFHNANINGAMERDMADRIRLKRDIISEINIEQEIG
jgi:hypothetical protein